MSSKMLRFLWTQKRVKTNLQPRWRKCDPTYELTTLDKYNVQQRREKLVTDPKDKNFAAIFETNVDLKLLDMIIQSKLYAAQK